MSPVYLQTVKTHHSDLLCPAFSVEPISGLSADTTHKPAPLGLLSQVPAKRWKLLARQSPLTLMI